MNQPSWLVLLLVLAVALIAASRLFTSVTILEFEQALKFIRGRYVGLVGPGLYWYLKRTTSFRRVDTRPTFTAVSGQEVLSADGVALKLSLLAIYRVTDPKMAILGIDDFTGAVHAQLQLALRSVVSGSLAEDLLQKRGEIPMQLVALAGPPLLAVGVELQSANVRDLTLPGDLKRVFSQVVRARQEGLAGLEKARGETAALRSLANAAQMVQRNPQLMQLRLLQLLEQHPGHTVVLGNSPGILPLSGRGERDDEDATSRGEASD